MLYDGYLQRLNYNGRITMGYCDVCVKQIQFCPTMVMLHYVSVKLYFKLNCIMMLKLFVLLASNRCLQLV